MADKGLVEGVSSLPAVGPPVKERDELDEVRRRLAELQDVLSEHFSRHSWDEYLRLRRVVKAQES